MRICSGSSDLMLRNPNAAKIISINPTMIRIISKIPDLFYHERERKKKQRLEQIFHVKNALQNPRR